MNLTVVEEIDGLTVCPSEINIAREVQIIIKQGQVTSNWTKLELELLLGILWSGHCYENWIEQNVWQFMDVWPHAQIIIVQSSLDKRKVSKLYNKRLRIFVEQFSSSYID